MKPYVSSGEIYAANLRHQGYERACRALKNLLGAARAMKDTHTALSNQIAKAVDALPNRELLDKLPKDTRETIEGMLVKLEIEYHSNAFIDLCKSEGLAAPSKEG